MLAFYARGDALVAVPGQNPFTEKRPPGSPRDAFDPSMDLGPVRRVGRDHIPAVVATTEDGEKTVKEPARQPASERPYKVREENVLVAQKLARRVREGALWPADERTAKFCGVKFTPVEFSDGEWVRAQPRRVSEPKKSPSKSDSATRVAS